MVIPESVHLLSFLLERVETKHVNSLWKENKHHRTNFHLLKSLFEHSLVLIAKIAATGSKKRSSILRPLAAKTSSIILSHFFWRYLKGLYSTFDPSFAISSHPVSEFSFRVYWKRRCNTKWMTKLGVLNSTSLSKETVTISLSSNEQCESHFIPKFALTL